MSKNKYMISVIIPCYNAADTIVRTLESVEEQTFKDYEVVLIDDGSLDNTKNIVTNYIKEKDNYVFLKQENKGVSTARNYGLNNAKGKYIAFLDADDVYHPLFLETLFNEIEKNRTDLACSQYQFMRMTENFDKTCNAGYKSEKITSRDVLERYMRKRKYRFSFANILYRRDIVVNTDIKFDKDLKYGEDSLFLGEYLANSNNGCVFVYKELYGYTINDKSAMHKKVSWQNVDNIEAMKKIVDYWKNKNLDTSFSDYMVARAIWGIAKDFSIDDQLFKKLQRTYDVKEAMREMKNECDEGIVRISSWFYLINVMSFKSIMSKMLKK